MLDLCGAQNVFADRERRYPARRGPRGSQAAAAEDKLGGRDIRYPRVTFDEVVARAPELVLLPDEPHPFTEEDARVFAALAIPAARGERIVRTSGKDLCWYGARSVEGIDRVRGLVDQLRASVASMPNTA